ncbi:MAG: dihydroneopterin aldolase [Lentisphaerae bacterium]|nr:dihydroneopterin aldolase [Lentisphaerota bacterium]MBQ9803409.1 dihydroneopterin aldolase [Lentisphaeria bacterium]
MEKIFIGNLKISAVIGTLEHERHTPQELCFDLELCCDGTAAAISDDLHDAVDYSAVEAAVVKTVSGSSFFLLEALTRSVGETILSFPQVLSCTVRVAKPAASRYGALISYQAAFDRSRG